MYIPLPVKFQSNIDDSVFRRKKKEEKQILPLFRPSRAKSRKTSVPFSAKGCFMGETGV